MRLKRMMVFAIAALLCFMSFSATAEETAWDCPKCGRKGNTGRFCGSCGFPEAEDPQEQPATITEVPAVSVSIGDYVSFGCYVQEEKKEPEPIEWMVLDIKEDEVLLLSRYGLDVQPYNKEYQSVTWEKSTLRKWLNEEFLHTAFTTEEQSLILLKTISNGSEQGNPEWDTPGGKDTEDYVFALSYAEAWEYFDSDAERRCAPTDYCLKHHATFSKSYRKDNRAAGWYWLRSPGGNQMFSTVVRHGGGLRTGMVNRTDVCVRPALWVSLYSGIF